MKAFEKWWKLKEKELNDFLDESFGKEKTATGWQLRQNIIIKSKLASAETWKAALEWVLSLDTFEGFCYECGDSEEIKKTIEEELNEGE